MQLLKVVHDMPIRSSMVVWAEFVELTGTTPDRLHELVEMGWIVPTRTADEALLFRSRDVYRLRKLERLCADFDLHTLGGSIVVDLLDRIDALENKIQELTNRRENLF